MAAIPRCSALFRRSSMTRDTLMHGCVSVTEAVVLGGAGLAHLARLGMTPAWVEGLSAQRAVLSS
eukprot:706010-Pyramimonas_sp.AAC.1